MVIVAGIVQAPAAIVFALGRYRNFITKNGLFRRRCLLRHQLFVSFVRSGYGGSRAAAGRHVLIRLVSTLIFSAWLPRPSGTALQKLAC